MSVLTPLYLLGALAIVGPIVFHLIRRSPRGEVPFSSLMFLSPTPPRLTRRSRISDWLLLLLRAAALALLAFAFARPFLREAAALDATGGEARRLLVLVDTSASLRRGDLWKQSQTLVDAALRDMRPNDELAVYAFDQTVRPILTFSESAATEPARRAAIARSRLSQLSPSWAATDLGGALIEAVGAIEDVGDSKADASRMPRRIVLVSDLQEGGNVESLGGFEWPKDVELDLRAVKTNAANAGLRRLADADDPEADESPAMRVQVTNDAAASSDRFTLNWRDAKNATVGPPIDAYVPAGQSRVFRVAKPHASVPLRSLDLKGDAHLFDDRLFVADQPRQELAVLYMGEEPADDANGLRYYLERLFQDLPERKVLVQQAAPQAALQLDVSRTPLVIVAAQPNQANIEALRAYMNAGGTVLYVLRSPGDAASAAAITGLPLGDVSEAQVDRDVMLGEIAFQHPLFSSLAAAQYNDFTKIRFWKYRRLSGEGVGEAHVLARFENRDPAIVEQPIGKGRAILFTSGWNPDDSQLARSSKFVPLMLAMLTLGRPQALDAVDLHVGDPVSLASLVEHAADANIAIETPAAATVSLAPGQTEFKATEVPGVYTAHVGDQHTSFAVNLDPAESRTAPLPVETLEQFGVKIARGPAVGENEARAQRQMLNAELEGRQKLWRWIVLATIGVLLMETWLAGRLARPRRPNVEASTT